MATPGVEAKVPTEDPLSGILSLLNTLGSGTTKTSSSTSSSGAANSQADALLASIQNSVNPDNMAALVQGILLKAKAGLGPNIAASIGFGNRTVSDSSLAQLQSEAQARATAESAQAILEAQTNANRLATQIVDTKLQTSRQTTQTQKTGVSPAGKVLGGLSLINQGRKLYKGIFGEDSATKEGNFNTPSGMSSGSGMNTFGIEGGENADIFNNLSDFSGSAGESSNVIDVIPPDIFSDLSDFSGSSGDFVGDSGGETFIGDTESSFGEGGVGTIVNIADRGLDKHDEDQATEGPDTDSTVNDDTGLANPEPGQPGGGDWVDVGSTGPTTPDDDNIFGWIICTELQKQKRLPYRYYIYGAREFAKYSGAHKQGYYIWAIPSVKHLKKYPDSLFSKILEKVFNWRVEYLAAKQGCKGARKLFRGWAITFVTYWLCVGISKFIPLNTYNFGAQNGRKFS
jgi:hypothetical protein